MKWLSCFKVRGFLLLNDTRSCSVPVGSPPWPTSQESSVCFLWNKQMGKGFFRSTGRVSSWHSRRCAFAQADNKRRCMLCRSTLQSSAEYNSTRGYVARMADCSGIASVVLQVWPASVQQLGNQRKEEFSECLLLGGWRATTQHKHSIYLKWTHCCQ